MYENCNNIIAKLFVTENEIERVINEKEKKSKLFGTEKEKEFLINGKSKKLETS